MRKKKLRDTVIVSKNFNQVIVGGRITTKGKLIKVYGYDYIKFVLDKKIFCVAMHGVARQVDALNLKSLVVVVGSIELKYNDDKPTNVVLVNEIELYSDQVTRRKKT